MTKWTVSQTPFRTAPWGELIQNIPPHVLVEETGRTEDVLKGSECSNWSEIAYGKSLGWCYSGYLEDYLERYPLEVFIATPTPPTTDAEQYTIYEGRTKYNLCGELCCAYLLHRGLIELLDKWKTEKPAYYTRIYKGVLDKGTGIDDLYSIFTMYGYVPGMLRFDLGLKDYVLSRAVLTPRRLLKMLEDYGPAIIGVRIGSVSGHLQVSGVAHWVALTGVDPNGIDDGFVEVYNPFKNRRQLYPWDQFYASVGSPWGLWLDQKELDKIIPV